MITIGLMNHPDSLRQSPITKPEQVQGFRYRGRLWLTLIVIPLAVAALSCSSVGYVSRSAAGQVGLLAKRRKIEKVVRDDATPQHLRERLERIVEVRDFASEQLALPDNRSYRYWVELDREYVVWNVVATPELSIAARQWCFPVSGCVTYRGYFSEKGAERFAEKLRRQGDDVRVRGVAAYSTLGWFADPVLSSFAFWRDDLVAGLVFHELTHQRVYVKGDTVFNESLASSVEAEGVRRWLEGNDRQDLLAAWLQGQERRRRFVELVLESRESLAEIYSMDVADEQKRHLKAVEFDELRERYVRLRDSEWSGWSGYDSFFGPDLNNAALASVGAYEELVPAFDRMLAMADGDLESFFEAVDEVASVKGRTAEQRRAALKAAGEVPPVGRGGG